jgi:SAM-dependent methyltransferase
MGIAALLTGAERYIAFDVVAHASADRNRAVLEELTALFAARADIPDDEEFPGVGPKLDDYRFPHELLPAARMTLALNPARIASIAVALANATESRSMIQYRAPWFDNSIIEPDTMDMIFSQAVLEHVDDLEQAYGAMRLWLAPGGFISHQIDFSSHGWANDWNGHWRHSDFKWKLIRGKDSWSINREPESTHLRLLEQHGFRIVARQSERAESKLTRRQLAPRFRDATAEDLATRSTFVQAVRR